MNAMTVALAGNPNSGKTTIFNALTGARQKVGNWPGVTVERKSGFFKVAETTIEVVDLPGTYSLVAVSENSSLDERIACDFILSRKADVIVNVLDANNLERSLYLTLQLLEMRVPMILAVNMLDVARQRQIKVLLDVLQKSFACPVIGLEADKKKSINVLKTCIAQHKTVSHITLPALDPVLKKIIEDIADQIAIKRESGEWMAVRLLENDVFVRPLISKELLQKIPAYQQDIQINLGEDADILFADRRYRFIQEITGHCIVRTGVLKKTMTERIDRIVLNRVCGIPIFLGMMYVMFLFAINIGGAFQDFFDISSNTIFVEGFAEVLTLMHMPNWLIALLTQGVGKGINTTITFIPVIGAMFLFLSFLEDSGYMARAAFVIDRLMRALGLPGKSFVPMIVGFGCNVPSVMGARTLDNKRDRILTVLMSPFMSCGARLAIFAVFTAAFFPKGGQNVVFILYITGIAIAMLTGLLLRKTVLKGDPAPLLMELPPYHVPQIKTLMLHVWQRLSGFVLRAGKLIIPICVLLGVLSGLNADGSISVGDGDTESLLAMVGRYVTPVFGPMGIFADNWPATVGLLTGILAKEVVIGTLNALYTQVGHFVSLHAEGFSFWGNLQAAVSSIPANLSNLAGAFGNPVLAQAPVSSLSDDVYGLMYEKFDGQIGAMAYLFFVLLYVPCVSTTAAMWRELNYAWALFSVFWSTAIAYGVAVGFYQLMTITQHPITSISWLAGIILFFMLVMVVMRLSAREKSLRGEYGLA